MTRIMAMAEAVETQISATSPAVQINTLNELPGRKTSHTYFCVPELLTAGVNNKKPRKTQSNTFRNLIGPTTCYSVDNDPFCGCNAT